MSSSFSSIAQSIRAKGPVSYGRKEQLDYIDQHLKYGRKKAIVIRGDHGTGKSSILEATQKKLKNGDWDSERRYHWFTISPDNISNCSDFAKNVWEGMLFSTKLSYEGSLGIELESPYIYDSNPGFIYRIDRYWQKFSDDAFVIFIDDFEKIFKNFSSSEYRKVIGLINDVVIHEPCFSCKGLIIFIVSLNQKLPQFSGSKLYAEDKLLKPLAFKYFKDMCIELLEGKYELPDESLLWLYEYTGGYPLFGWLLLANIFDYMEQNQKAQFLSKEELYDTKDTIIKSLRADQEVEEWFYELREEEQEVMLRLAATDDGFLSSSLFVPPSSTPGESKMRTICNELEDRQYLIALNEGYKIRIPFVYDWLINWVGFDDNIIKYAIQPNVDFPTEGLCIDFSSKQVFLKGKEIQVIPSVFDALVCLARHPRGTVVSNDELSSAITHQDFYVGDDSVVNQTVHRIRESFRKAIGEKGADLLKTRYKQGYYLDCDVILLHYVNPQI